MLPILIATAVASLIMFTLFFVIPIVDRTRQLSRQVETRSATATPSNVTSRVAPSN